MAARFADALDAGLAETAIDGCLFENRDLAGRTDEGVKIRRLRAAGHVVQLPYLDHEGHPDLDQVQGFATAPTDALDRFAPEKEISRDAHQRNHAEVLEE